MDSSKADQGEKPRGALYRGCDWLTKHPVVSVLLIFSGWFFSIYTWRDGVKDRQLAYYVSGTRTPIVQKGRLENFKVSFMDKPVNGDLSAVEVQIWNAGKEPIRNTDILKPITLRMVGSNQPIYQVTTNWTRGEIGFTHDGGTNGTLNMSWNVLEQDDGVKLQIIYNGSVDSEVKVEGTILGKVPIKEAKSDKAHPNLKGILSFFFFLVFIVSIALAYGIVSQKLQKYFAPHWEANRWPKWAKVVSVLFMIAACFAAEAIGNAVANHIIAPDKPPFGF